ncbi:hypothetical protein GUITHDRAFT_112757 [Guillardia theta CCMP2712]|uniref:RING-type domain-containing protein n=1 Tax=Guillardia theta (strain CCMP2712) TaxID=905079 RepID=L1IZR7_GUITC|nr:hypothetical protein GUITHDRAFT_112757 [Guillardia theta CCMP2712]EKX41295.1 hypothetical protein GUITHDRAFT_112757 [Guillardia theta CCMP2712]|eukprot:XP_005828275.1 hypothetical protein GUITHDRAFT_112757 [Guillardia theta CCMP2712]
MEDREARRARQAAIVAEKRARLEAQIKASTDFIFGGGQQQQANHQLGRFRPPAFPPHRAPAAVHPAVPQRAPAEPRHGAQPTARSFDFVACERCLLPVRGVELEEHRQQSCVPCRSDDDQERVPDDAASKQVSDAQGPQVDAAGVVPTAAVNAEASGGGNVQSWTVRGECVICLEGAGVKEGVEEGVRCSGGAHFVCCDCLDPYVRSQSEENDIFRARGAKIVCPMGAEGCSSSFSHKDLALHVSHDTFERYLRARELAHETRVLEDLRLDDEKRAKDEKSGKLSEDNVLTISIPTRQVHSRPYPHAGLSSRLEVHEMRANVVSALFALKIAPPMRMRTLQGVRGTHARTCFRDVSGSRRHNGLVGLRWSDHAAVTWEGELTGRQMRLLLSRLSSAVKQHVLSLLEPHLADLNIRVSEV